MAKAQEELGKCSGTFALPLPEPKTPRVFNLEVFFALVRPNMRGGKLTSAQVRGMEALLTGGGHDCCAWIAYVLATADHETGGRFYALREGFSKTDAGARKAVTALYNKGGIKNNYSLPAGPHNMCYYGRGLVQLTWLENYEKTGEQLGLDLVRNPDLMLDLDVSVAAIWSGMRAGTYRKHSLSSKLPETVDPTKEQWRAARGIINGDTRRNGTRIAERAEMFYTAVLAASLGD